MKNLQDNQRDQVAVVVGGGNGLGLALAKRLSRDGLVVVIFDVDDQRLEAATTAPSGIRRGYNVNVTQTREVNSAVAAVLTEFGRIDVLVNCAGITGETNIKSHEVDLDDFDRVININLKGSLITSKSVLPHMLAQKYGRILHVASIAGKEGNVGMLAYSASKAAVIAMTKVQGKEYAETGITVNAIAPAVIRTDLVDRMPDQQVNYMTKKIPMRRCGTVEEFANLAAFIVSRGNSFTTGFTYDLSGGRAVY